MATPSAIQSSVDLLVSFSTHYLMPLMIGAFFMAIGMRALIYVTIKREDWFAKEFEKRVHQFSSSEGEGLAFFSIVKSLLEKTFYELFKVRSIKKRRNPDAIMDWTDRVFLIQPGCAFLVRDTLKQIRYLKGGGSHPKLHEISKNIFQNNPCFNRVLGLIPMKVSNDLLNILPGTFIIGGILGTFLGIMRALPELSHIDLTNASASNQVMNKFLLQIAFSMSTSIVGIILSLGMTIVNTLLSPEKLFIETVDRFENSLDLLWSKADHSKEIREKDLAEFDQDRDAIEALSEEESSRDDEDFDEQEEESKDHIADILPLREPIPEEDDWEYDEYELEDDEYEKVG